MKTSLLVILAASTLVLGVVCWNQRRELAAQQAHLETLRATLAQQKQQLDELESTQTLLERQRRQLLDQSRELAARLEARSPTAPPEATPGTPAGPANAQPERDRGGLGGVMARVLEDPETRKLLREQQRLVLDQLYGPLMRKLQLTPEEADQFKELLLNQMGQGMELASAWFGPGAATNRTELAAQLAREQKAFDEQIRALLGENRYFQYKDYQETVGERAQLNQFRQLAGGDAALSEPQVEQLLTIMREEKRAVAAAGLPVAGSEPDEANLQLLMSEGGMEKLLQSQEEVQQRVWERAREVLSPAQLESFGQFQTNQLRMMRMGLNMARQFMAPEAAKPPAR